MFKSFEQINRVNRTGLRQAFVRAVSGIVLAAAGFQAVYSIIFAVE